MTASDGASSVIQEVARAVSDLNDASATITIKGKVEDVPVEATGNFGLAKAAGTLMGELGPELVVQNGRYFVAG